MDVPLHTVQYTQGHFHLNRRLHVYVHQHTHISLPIHVYLFAPVCSAVYTEKHAGKVLNIYSAHESDKKLEYIPDKVSVLTRCQGCLSQMDVTVQARILLSFSPDFSGSFSSLCVYRQFFQSMCLRF